MRTPQRYLSGHVHIRLNWRTTLNCIVSRQAELLPLMNKKSKMNKGCIIYSCKDEGEGYSGCNWYCGAFTWDLSLLAQLALIPSITGHQYFAILMGVILLIAFISTLFLPTKKMRRTTVMWMAFSILLALRGTLILTWMWRTSTPIAEFNTFVVSWFGLHDAESIIRFLINPQIIPQHFDATINTIEHIGYFHSIIDGVVMLSHHISGLVIEVAKIVFPVFAIIGAIRNKSKMPKIEKPIPSIENRDSDGRVLDEKQIEAQRKKEEQELQRKLEEMRCQKEAEQREEVKRSEKQQQDESQRQKFNDLSRAR